jgi:peptidoglycan/xylan/chitin deacetylase (PgdA/CDA1 family)
MKEHTGAHKNEELPSAQFYTTFLVVLFCILFLTIRCYNQYRNSHPRSDTVGEELPQPISQAESVETVIDKLQLATSSTNVVPILVYHKIAPKDFVPKKKSDEHYNVHEDVFAQQMQYLDDNGYTALTMKDLIAREKNHTLPAKPVAITLDDGWREQYDNALPVLLMHHFPATFYIYSSVIGGRAYMSLDEIQSLVYLNMEIGGHTKTHPMLAKIPRERLHAEIFDNKKYLEEKLHTSVTDFAYPYGNFNENVIKMLIEAGYETGRTSGNDIHNDFHDLYRLHVLYAPATLDEFKKILRVK